MKLLIDAGNRRLKWAASRGGALEVGDAIDLAAAELERKLAAAWAGLARPESVWASCVAGAAVERAIAGACRVWGVRPAFIEAQARRCGVVNSYARPAELGGDRWAALVGARRLRPRRAVVVVDAGTAVTVDALDAAGVFRGGVILPGARAMRNALARQTANLGDGGGGGDGGDGGGPGGDDGDGDAPTALATDTAAAVRAGAWLAVAGGVDRAIAAQLAAMPGRDGGKVLLTGGDAVRLAPLLAADTEHAPDLVLRGLAALAESA